ncbi:hypothetical protein Q7P37_009135 [Cladosporium fusiforme]
MDEHSKKLVRQAFQFDNQLQGRIIEASGKSTFPVQNATAANPSVETFQHGVPELLRDICAHILAHHAPSIPGKQNNLPEEPTAKKRKIEQTQEAASRSLESEAGSYHISHPPVVSFECKDVSFTSPLRKKLKLQFVHDSMNLLLRQIRLLNQATNAVEYTLRGEDVDTMFCLPMPEKAQRQQTFVVFPLPGAQSYDGTPAEPLVWTMNETKGKPETVSVASRLDVTEEDTFVDVTLRELNHFMASLSKKTILPDEREFASEIPQSHRKGEKAFHTKAFRGSKEGPSSPSPMNEKKQSLTCPSGYLFLLSTGIVFGFKKPVAYFPLNAIESISFTSVLQRTFNIVITTLSEPTSSSGEEEKRTEHELSMVDQADFQPIDAYIRAHGLNDASMAAERRAKAYNVNKPAAGEEAAGEDADGRGEIEKAEEMLQDAEDEEEEDYDPSGGESEGSGEDSDEEGEEGYEDGEGDEEEEEWDEDDEVEAEEEPESKQ